MKLHEYLWEYIDYQNKNPGLSDLEAQGHVRQFLGGEQIIAAQQRREAERAGGPVHPGPQREAPAGGLRDGQ